MTEERYVQTGEIRSAVEGREEAVLDALSIPFRNGKPHIDCPYPSHGGTNDWRWDDKKLRARCTCTGGDSIFDVVMKCESIEFEEAKVYVAEAIGSQHLIKVKGAGKGKKAEHENQFQKTTAEGLMNPASVYRDDALVANYLGSRLGISDEDVFLPTTPFRGITHSVYYEGGGKRNSDPKVVGVFPAVVFKTLDAERRTHAHRIFVGPNGRGKAYLGEVNGSPRDAKKSAKLTGDENIAGRSVIWGIPTEAAHIVITEGIETGQAVAQALKAEIEAREVAVAAAITAVGVEAFIPWPATRTVTIAADRDDAEKRGKPGSQRGEQAARKFALRNLDKVKTSIALPGTAGQSLDWLDVYVADGEPAVRQGVLAAVPFVGTPEELAERRSLVDKHAELEAIAAAYPLPAMNTRTLSYAHDQADRIKIHKVVMEKDPVTKQDRLVSIPVMTPMGIKARLRNADQANGYGLRIVVQDMAGRPREIDIDRAALSKMNGSEIKSMLFDAGLSVEDDGEHVAIAMLKAVQPDREIIIHNRSAWHDRDGGSDPFFLSPAGDVVGDLEGEIVELAAAVRMPANIARSGTLQGWKDAVACAAAQSECPHWLLGIVSGFAGPIVGLTNMDTCGINLSGRSSSGKTTAQKLAVSSWSTPDTTKPGLAQSARATGNAIEALSQRSTGTILSLDELAHVSGKETGKMIYTIAGGVGKARMRADSSIRDSYSWSTFAILSAESSLQEKIEGDGEKFMAGMAVRIVDVDVTGVDRNVPKADMQRIEAVGRHFGHAGPAFVEGLIREGVHRKAADLREEINRRAALIAGEGSDSALLRAALPFAILLTAGHLAQTFGLIPKDADIGRAISWAWGRFQRSSDAEALNPNETAINALRLWIAERWGVSIRDINTEGGGSQAAVAWFDADHVYIPKERLREAAGGALKEQELVSALEDGECIGKREDAKRAYIRYVPKVGAVKAYALRRKKFGRTSATFDPDAFRVVEGGLGND